MKRKKFSEDRIFQIIKKVEGGKTIASVCRTHGIILSRFIGVAL